MAFEIIFAPRAVHGMKNLRPRQRTEVRDAIEIHLRHEPEKISRSRIKRLRGLNHPQYRLRVGEVRVFYDVVGHEVHIVSIVMKSAADHWLKMFGVKP